MYNQELVQNVKAILNNFETQTGRKVDLIKIHSQTRQLEDFRAIQDFIEISDIEIGFDDRLPVNQFVFLNKQDSAEALPEAA